MSNHLAHLVSQRTVLRALALEPLYTNRLNQNPPLEAGFHWGKRAIEIASVAASIRYETCVLILTPRIRFEFSLFHVRMEVAVIRVYNIIMIVVQTQ